MLLTLATSKMLTPFFNLFLGSATGNSCFSIGRFGASQEYRLQLSRESLPPTSSHPEAGCLYYASHSQRGRVKKAAEFIQPMGMLLSEILVSLQNGLTLLSFQTSLTLLSYLSVYHEEKHCYANWSLELDFLTVI